VHSYGNFKQTQLNIAARVIKDRLKITIHFFVGYRRKLWAYNCRKS
jgi:hypothetical protein